MTFRRRIPSCAGRKREGRASACSEGRASARAGRRERELTALRRENRRLRGRLRDIGGGAAARPADAAASGRMASLARESEDTRRLLTAIINATPDFILVKDRQFRFILANESAARSIGRRPGEMIGKNELELGLPEEFILGAPEYRGARDYDREVLAGRHVHIPLDQIILEDGLLHFFDTHKIPLRDAQGRVYAILVFAHDITDRVTAEKRLRESEEKFRMISEQSLLAIGIYQDDRMVYVNHAFADLVECRPDELKSWDRDRLLKLIHPEDRDYVLENARRRLSDEAEPRKRYSYRIIPASGRPAYVEQYARRITYQERPAILTAWVDVTDRIRSEQEKRQLEERLSRLRKMEALGLLAGGVAHDLNNVLSGVVGYPDLLLLGLPEDSPIRDTIIAIRECGKRAAAVVEDLLTLARRGVAQHRTLDLNALVRECVESPEIVAFRSEFPDIRLETRLDPDLLLIRGSLIHIKKTLINLLRNAAEAQPGGGTIVASTESRYLGRPLKGYELIREGEFSVLRVADQGVGISTEDLARIFEPFYTRKVMGRSGTGLGMAVVWGTARDHGGYIDVISEPGRGTCFELYFPVTREALETDIVVPRSAYKGRGETILVVDDVFEQLDIASRMLGFLGYLVRTADSGEAAVACLGEHPADLVILDMLMDPGIDGLETYRRIKQIRPDQKAIIASGYAETDAVRQTQALGAGRFIKKPYSLENLGMAVRMELDREVIRRAGQGSGSDTLTHLNTSG